MAHRRVTLAETNRVLPKEKDLITYLPHLKDQHRGALSIADPDCVLSSVVIYYNSLADKFWTEVIVNLSANLSNQNGRNFSESRKIMIMPCGMKELSESHPDCSTHSFWYDNSRKILDITDAVIRYISNAVSRSLPENLMTFRSTGCQLSGRSFIKEPVGEPCDLLTRFPIIEDPSHVCNSISREHSVTTRQKFVLLLRQTLEYLINEDHAVSFTPRTTATVQIPSRAIHPECAFMGGFHACEFPYVIEAVNPSRPPIPHDNANDSESSLDPEKERRCIVSYSGFIVGVYGQYPIESCLSLPLSAYIPFTSALGLWQVDPISQKLLSLAKADFPTTPPVKSGSFLDQTFQRSFPHDSISSASDYRNLIEQLHEWKYYMRDKYDPDYTADPSKYSLLHENSFPAYSLSCSEDSSGTSKMTAALTRQDLSACMDLTPDEPAFLRAVMLFYIRQCVLQYFSNDADEDRYLIPGPNAVCNEEDSEIRSLYATILSEGGFRNFHASVYSPWPESEFLYLPVVPDSYYETHDIRCVTSDFIHGNSASFCGLDAHEQLCDIQYRKATDDEIIQYGTRSDCAVMTESIFNRLCELAQSGSELTIADLTPSFPHIGEYLQTKSPHRLSSYQSHLEIITFLISHNYDAIWDLTRRQCKFSEYTQNQWKAKYSQVDAILNRSDCPGRFIQAARLLEIIDEYRDVDMQEFSPLYPKNIPVFLSHITSPCDLIKHSS